MHQRELTRRARPLSTVTGVEKGLNKDAPKKISADPNPLLDTTAMIRSLQRSEGLEDCYRRGHEVCDHLECPWRRYCLTP
jgi:hypothetical protein